MSAGHSVIVDAVFAKPDERAEIAKIAPAAFDGLFLTASLGTRLSRVGGRSGDASDADTIVARRQEDFDLGQISWTKVERLRHARGNTDPSRGGAWQRDSQLYVSVTRSSAACRMRLQIQVLNASTSREIDAAFGTVARENSPTWRSAMQSPRYMGRGYIPKLAG